MNRDPKRIYDDADFAAAYETETQRPCIQSTEFAAALATRSDSEVLHVLSLLGRVERRMVLDALKRNHGITIGGRS